MKGPIQRSKKAGWAPYLLALGLVALSVYYPYLAADEYTYLNLATSISVGQVEGALEGFRMPFLPAILSLIFSIVGSSLVAAKLVIGFFWIALIFVVGLLAKELWNDSEKTWYAQLLTATSPILAFFSTRVLTEIPFIFLLVLSVYYLYKAEKETKFFVPLGVTVALLFLTRYVGLYFFLIAFVYLFKNKKLNTLFSKDFFLGLVSFLVALFPWMYVSYLQNGNPLGFFFSFFSTQFGQVQGVMSWPDKVPLYLITIPFLLGLTSLVLWKTVYESVKVSSWKKEWIKNEWFILLVTVFGVWFVMETYSLFSQRLARYIMVIIPFLAILAVGGIQKEWWNQPFVKKGIILLVILNALISLVIVAGFYQLYTKHQDYHYAGLFVQQECETFNATIDYALFYYTKNKSVSLSENPTCLVVSEHDGNIEPVGSSYNQLVFESGKIKVFKRS